jgi:hypothetical protein
VLTSALALALFSGANAQTMTLSISSNDFQVSTVFSSVDLFDIEIEIDAPLATGVYDNPEIVSVDYQVTGTLTPGTPSDFPAFDLQRSITGEDFYAQGSSLRFEIAPSAVLSDGVQAAELVGDTLVFTFNGREVDNGRFHPALLELNADGTGRIQNSDNVPSLDPLLEVAFGAEYITDLTFDPGNTTVIVSTPVTIPGSSNGGGGAASPVFLALLWLLILLNRLYRIRQSRG